MCSCSFCPCLQKREERKGERGEKREEKGEERSVQDERERGVKSQEERKTDIEREGGGEEQEDVNSLHDGCHVSNTHTTWWQNAWWIRVDNGPHMRSARERRRTWRAVRQAAEQVCDGNWVEKTQKLVEEAEGEKWRRKKWEKWGRKKRRKQHPARCLPLPNRKHSNSNNSRSSSNRGNAFAMTGLLSTVVEKNDHR